MSSNASSPSVVLVSQFFDPDTSANSILLSDVAYGLADRGVDVTVVTTQPSYTDDDRTSKQPTSEVVDGVQIRRLPATRFDRNAGLAKRMLNELSFFLAAFVYLAVRKRGDVLLLPTSPTFMPIAGWPLRYRGYRPVPIVMDLYPSMAVALDYLEADSPIRRVWDWLNRRAYPKAELTVTIGERMAERIQAEYGPIPVRVIHNWEDGEFIEPTEKADNEFARRHGFDAQLTVLYSGNLGRHHELESVLEAATALEEDDDVTGFEFVFIGDGGTKEKLQRMARERDLESVQFLPYQPEEELPKSLTSGDVSLVTMRRAVEGLCVPSKFYTALASGQAVLAVATPTSEIARVVERTDCGLVVEPGDAEGLEEAVRFWLENPERVIEMGNAARNAFESGYTKNAAIDEYHDVVRTIASEPTSKPSMPVQAGRSG
ncbi:glycosyltransferase family 4 protein [Halopiger goleimassiliensis]|uniref:glycosyltransferase family 4 protein n=1 Tax=Halopiger goleimassiliensis TaxID=1293048 RepID=UPI00067803FF|nr:glycosyltransferase family 4 protein [Halopiger goleimassiliensis]